MKEYFENLDKACISSLTPGSILGRAVEVGYTPTGVTDVYSHDLLADLVVHNGEWLYDYSIPVGSVDDFNEIVTPILEA